MPTVDFLVRGKVPQPVMVPRTFPARFPEKRPLEPQEERLLDPWAVPFVVEKARRGELIESGQAYERLSEAEKEQQQQLYTERITRDFFRGLEKRGARRLRATEAGLQPTAGVPFAPARVPYGFESPTAEGLPGREPWRGAAGAGLYELGLDRPALELAKQVPFRIVPEAERRRLDPTLAAWMHGGGAGAEGAFLSPALRPAERGWQPKFEPSAYRHEIAHSWQQRAMTDEEFLRFLRQAYDWANERNDRYLIGLIYKDPMHAYTYFIDHFVPVGGKLSDLPAEVREFYKGFLPE